MTIPFPIRDHQENFIEPGKRKIMKQHWFGVDDTVLPSWITTEAASGIFTVNPVSTGRPGLTISEPIAGHAKVFINGTISRAGLVAARLTFMGVRSTGDPNTHTVYVRLDDNPATDGAVMTCVAGDVPASITTRPNQGATALQHQYHTVGNQYDADPANWEHRFKGADISLMVVFEGGKGMVWAQEGIGDKRRDVGYRREPGISQTGTIAPRLTYQGSSTKPLQIAGVSLELWYN